MKIKLISICLLSVFLTGCILNPYTNSKYGEQVIEAWFSYENGDDDLGKTRRSVENIGTLEGSECTFIEKYKSNYIFKCTISYKELGETVIPFSKSKTLDLYAVFTPDGDNFTYKVYNSSSADKIWQSDEELK